MNERTNFGSANQSMWAPSVILEGRVARRMGPLMPDSVDSRYSEMYIHDSVHNVGTDTGEEPHVWSTHRGQSVILPTTASQPERRRICDLFDRYYSYVLQENKYVQSMVCASEQISNMTTAEQEQYVVVISGKRTVAEQAAARTQQDRRLFAGRGSTSAGHLGAGRRQEVCMLCPRSLSMAEKCQVVLQLRSGPLQYIPIEHRSFDALYHVLLHPNGYDGWEDDMPFRSERKAWLTLPAQNRVPGTRGPAGSSAIDPRNKVSMLEYYAYRLHYRRGQRRSDNCLFMTGRLFQEYACVGFWRCETGRLNMHRLAQQNMRAARTGSLREFVDDQAARRRQGLECTHDVGRMSYLPEQFVGGPRDMMARYQDVMTSVLYHGAPSLFITMTANPRWDEVQKSLPFAQTAADRYDIISRVFKAKLASLLADIKSEEVFGRHVGHAYAIEFQKRGLPHAHIVVILAAGDRPRNASAINEMTSSEIPPCPDADDQSDAAIAQRRLRSLVLEHMLHNDCSGSNGRRCPCWDADRRKCRGDFPWKYMDETVVGDDRRRSVYRRRSGDKWTADVNGRQVTNQWVVPYNAFLLLKYECHLNVEVVTAAYAVKYLFKYVFKGSDQACAAIRVAEKTADEIGAYQAMRYLGAAEACWRLFKFATAYLTDTVYRMAVSLPEDR